MNKTLSLLGAAGLGMLAVAGAAQAQTFPTQIVGQWTMRANDSSLTFTVQQQSGDSPCAAITGVIGAPNDGLVGYYCPATGAVSFLRNSANTGATFQVFTGQVSGAGNYGTLMTGNFSNYSGGDDTGAFGFTASLPTP